MEAIILAGGLGTRLKTAVPDLPKCLAPVNGRPFLAILLDMLAGQGFERVILALGYQAGMIMTHFGDAYAGMRLVYSVEEAPLGTGGALRLALPLLDGEHAFVLNGDTYLRLEAAEIEGRWQARRLPLVVVREVEDTGRFGRVEVEAERITGFLEKRGGGPGLVNAGCYVVSKTLLDDFAPGVKFSFETDFLERGVLSGLDLDYFVTRSSFIDIGVPEDYLRARTELVKL